MPVACRPELCEYSVFPSLAKTLFYKGDSKAKSRGIDGLGASRSFRFGQNRFLLGVLVAEFPHSLDPMSVFDAAIFNFPKAAGRLSWIK